MPYVDHHRCHRMGHRRSVQLQHRGRYIWCRNSILQDYLYTGWSSRIIHHIFLLVSRQRLILTFINIQKMPTDTLSAGIFCCRTTCAQMFYHTLLLKSSYKTSLIIINPMHTASEITRGIDIIPGFLISEPSSANLLCLLNIPKTSSFLPLITASA